MAYIVPSVLVYQQLEQAGGVLNSTPDLDAVIIGPMYNIVRVDSTDGDSLTASQVEAISGPNDTNDAITMVPGSTIEDWDAEQTAITDIDGGETGFRMTIPSAVAGQDVLETELDVHFTEAFVQTNSFSAYLPHVTTTIDKNLIGQTGDTDFTVGPKYLMTDILKDGSGAYTQVGDKIIYTYGPTGTEFGPNETTVIALEDSNTTIRVSDAIPAAATHLTDTMIAAVYRNYDYIQVDDSYVTTTNASSLDQVEIAFTTSAFPTEPTPLDFQFLSGTLHNSYRALRTDQVSTVLNIANPDELESKVGDNTSDNPLGLGCELALANTTTSIKAVSIESDDLSGYLQALDLIEEESIAYAIVPLTQNIGILNAVKAHVVQMSTPENGAWRVGIFNTEISDYKFIGQANDEVGNQADGDSAVDLTPAAERLYLDVTTSGVDFISDGVTPTDTLVVTTTGVNGIPIGSYEIEKIMSSTRVELSASAALIGTIDPGVGSEFYIQRSLTKDQQAEEVALTSESFNSSRVWHVQPDIVGVDVNGITEYLPGYYLCCGLAGMTAGFPVQQGFTNIAVAGITDLQHSNFYFSKDQLGTMAEKGTCLFVQATQGGTPYCRHELTTDISVLQYREIVKVKNADFLSYYYRDKLKPFIGAWNITEDTLNNMRQTVVAASEILIARKLPRIGAPLLAYDLLLLEQDANNEDQVNIELDVTTVTPNNYTNLFLIL